MLQNLKFPVSSYFFPKMSGLTVGYAAIGSRKSILSDMQVCFISSNGFDFESSLGGFSDVLKKTHFSVK